MDWERGGAEEEGKRRRWVSDTRRGRRSTKGKNGGGGLEREMDFNEVSYRGSVRGVLNIVVRHFQTDKNPLV